MEHTEFVIQYLQNIGYKARWSQMLQFDHAIVVRFHTEPNPYKGTERPQGKIQMTATIPAELEDGTGIKIEYLDCNGIVEESDGLTVPQHTVLNQALGHYSNLLQTLGERAAEDAWNMSEGITIEIPDVYTAWAFTLENFDSKVTALADSQSIPPGFAYHYHHAINTLREHKELLNRLKQNTLAMSTDE